MGDVRKTVSEPVVRPVDLIASLDRALLGSGVLTLGLSIALDPTLGVFFAILGMIFLLFVFVLFVFLSVVIATKIGSSQSRVQQPFGTHLLTIAEFFFSHQSFEGILEPTVLDVREEYHEALYTNRRWKARWVLVRGYWSFFKAAGLTSLVKIGKSAAKMWKLIP